MELQSELFSLSRLDQLDQLGHIIHQIQDMAVPMHVVPVMHGLGDGFESLPIRDLDLVDQTRCSRLISALDRDPYEIHQRTAAQTLQKVRTQGFTYFKNGAKRWSSWTGFWKEGQGLEFGQVGHLGDHFGRASFYIHGDLIQIDQEIYHQFKRDQLRLAIDATQRALLWWTRLSRQ